MANVTDIIPVQDDPNALTWQEVAELGLEPEPGNMGQEAEV